MIITKLNGIGVLIVLAIGSIFLSLTHGSTFISLNDIFSSFIGHEDTIERDILISLRLPRTCSAFVTGGLLALAGAMMQLLVRNPMADPYVLGASSGAAVMVLLSLLCGLSGIWLTASAWVGSLLTILMVFLFAQKPTGWHAETLLLTGIALASGFSALISFILVISPDNALHSMLFWMLGDLSDTHAPYLETIILITCLIMGLLLANPFNLLLRGEFESQVLGVNTQKIRYQLYFMSSLLTAAAVSLAGCIGFIGLIVPHLFRFVFGHDHRYLLPGSVLLGGTLLTCADTLSRTLFAPQQLPVGIYMALIGIPLFLFLLQKKNP